MNIPFLFDMPGSMEWLLIILAIIAMIILVGGFAFLIYYIVKKAVKDAHRE